MLIFWSSETSEVNQKMLHMGDLIQRINDYHDQMHELDEKAEENVFASIESLTGLDLDSLNEETVDEYQPIVNEYIREYLENDAKHKAKLSILQAEKYKIVAELGDSNRT